MLSCCFRGSSSNPASLLKVINEMRFVSRAADIVYLSSTIYAALLQQ